MRSFKHFDTHAGATAVRAPRLRGCLAACLVAVAATAAAGPADAPSTPSPAQRYQLALEAQTAGEHARMLDELRGAAEGGEVRAQEMLVTVLLAGPVLYGPAVAFDRCEAWRWSRAAAAQGSPVGRHQWQMLGRLQHTPLDLAACD